ncbi:MAG: long-chain fatty acid--CoA ligase [Verrucomicrobia bacterium]|nr:long-chain fatty acid--CoA ligase [Verrucomicrobiota bacterium]
MPTPRRVFDLLQLQLERFPQPDAFAQKVGHQWKTYSTAESLEIVAALAWGLHTLGVRKGDRVANVSETNRVEWNFIDGAVMSLGAVHVPIYPNLSAEEFEFILSDSEAKLLFVSSERLHQLIAPLLRKLPALEYIYTYDPVNRIKQWTQIKTSGENGLTDRSNKIALEKIKAEVKPEDLATLIYTSGTTGNPKGVMLSHANLIANCVTCAPIIRSGSHDRALSFLPLCHIYERTVINLYVYCGTSIYYAQNLDTIGEDLREVRPNIFSTVPRLLEKIYERIVARGSQLSGMKKTLYFWALRLASEFEPNAPISWTKRLQLAIADRLVFARWREAVGGRIRAIISGSAALQPRLARIFWAARIPVYEGYGPTEASPVIAVNHSAKGAFKVGTVGPVIPGGEVKIAEDGEILYRGPNVMMGYYHRPDLTSETIDADGWLHTGDVGEFDGSFLKITDRKKEIFKTSGGKYVAPQQVENKMKESRYIAQIMVVGENRKFPGALIVPAFKIIARHFDKRGVHLNSNSEIAAHPGVNALIEAEIQRLNQNFGRYAQIKKFVLLEEDWSMAAGELTPTLKLKRRHLLKKYAREIDSLYVADTPAPDGVLGDKKLPKAHLRGA